MIVPAFLQPCAALDGPVVLRVLFALALAECREGKGDESAEAAVGGRAAAGCRSGRGYRLPRQHNHSERWAKWTPRSRDKKKGWIKKACTPLSLWKAGFIFSGFLFVFALPRTLVCKLPPTCKQQFSCKSWFMSHFVAVLRRVDTGKRH